MTAERTTTEIEVLRPCPVCASPFTAYLRHVPTRRTKRWIPLYVCLDCDSLSNPSGYAETPEQLSADRQWHISVAERNGDAAGVLFDRLAPLRCDRARSSRSAAASGRR